MKIFYLGLAMIFLLTYVSCLSPSDKSEIDLILLNGVVWTVNPDQPWAEAVAISGQNIFAVGSTKDHKKDWKDLPQKRWISKVLLYFQDLSIATHIF